ncbi:MAG TPA: hypothetical protein VIO14_06305 [Dehalococcoidia bacterium]
MEGMPPLRPYQRQVVRAVLDSVRNRRGLSFSVQIARQGGKNELSAQLEALLLAANAFHGGDAVKAAPTLSPQARISLRRLRDRLEQCGFGRVYRVEAGHVVRLVRARQVFLSAEPASNVVGHTADTLLEVDEAQDVDPEKFDRDFRPMAAARNATVVFYGTAWEESSLLERMRQHHLAQERRDGVRRHFQIGWEEVARHNPSYAAYVAAERERLGEAHPLFQTQYCLRPLAGGGRLLSPAQLSLLLGRHPRQAGARPGETYVAGLDVAGEAADGAAAARHDATVLTVARAAFPPAGEVVREPALEVVALYRWRGEPHDALVAQVAALLRRTWAVRRVAVDATGLGETVARLLTGTLGEAAVRPYRFTAESKSRLGFALLAAVNGGQLRLHAADGSAEYAECRRELELARAIYRPNRTMSFFVDPAEGHDDYLMSLALTVEAAAGLLPRAARGRLRER